MDLQTNGLLNLRKHRINIDFIMNYKSIRLNYLSQSKQVAALEKAKIPIAENQELSLQINQNDSHHIQVKFPGIKDEYEANTDREEMYEIYKYGKNRAFPWSGGKHIFEVIIDGSVYYALLNIKQKNIADEEFADMHVYLEEQLRGITQNYHKLTELIDGGLMGDPSYNQLIHWLLKNLNKLVSALILIEHNHESSLKKVYNVENIPKHLDAKSIKWNTSLKGVIHSGNKYYNRKNIMIANSQENQYVKMNTLSIVTTLRSEKKRLLKEIELAGEKIETQEKEVCTIRQRILKARDSRNISSRAIDKLGGSLANAERELNNLKSLYDKWLTSYKYLKNNSRKINNLLHNHFWRRVGSITSMKNTINSNRSYMPFEIIRKQFLEVKSNITIEEKSPIKSHVLHPTSLLYEYYTFFQIAEILELIDYNKSGQSKELQEGYLFSELLSNTVIEFEKFDTRIDLVFDQEVNYGSMSDGKDGSYFFSRSVNRRPDVRIDLYIFDELYEDYLYDSSLVIEVKYRPLFNIYSDVEFTDEMDQLDAYRKIRHYCSIRESFIDGIEDIICVYPGNGEKTHFTSEAGTYLILRPAREIAFQDYMKKKLANWIESRSRVFI